MFKLAVILSLAWVSHGLSVPTRQTRTDLCRYFLYTRTNGGIPVPVLADSTLASAGIDDSLTTVILVHGHQGSAFTSLNPYIINVLLNAENVNIITIDWSTFAAGTYSSAVAVAHLIAASLNNFITELETEAGVDLAKVHIVGFNLGAHIAGIAARTLTNKVGRITGLDPSGSQWGSSSPRLTSTDATYVEVIHTDGSGLLANGLGTAIGTVDFFANGGSNQPGCLTHACSHNRAYELFAASLVNPGLLGYYCSSNLQLSLNLCKGTSLRMGTNELSKIGPGTYRINTGRSFPF